MSSFWRNETKVAIDEFGAEVIVLGCGEMINLSEELFEILEVPVINPLFVAVKMAETLATLRLKNNEA